LPRGRRIWLAAQWVFAVAVIWYAARSLAGHWSEAGDRLMATRPVWSLVGVATVLVLASYVVLIDAWRRLLAAWSARLTWLHAARIWLASNLGKYVPGKIWSILAMGALARERGASAVAAGGSSLVMQAMSVVTGLTVAAVFGATTRGALWGAVLAVAITIAAIVTAPAILPRLAVRLSALTGRSVPVPAVPQRAVWLAAGTTVVAWLLTGYAFRLFSESLGIARGATGAYIAVYAASYVAGFLALFAPGGIGVREGALVATMHRAGLATPAEAAVVAVASRIWLTVLELVPGLIALALPARGVTAENARQENE
jgi:glycosyltransferase 2 family protein